MWYFTWILGLLLACSLGIINVLRLEAQETWDKEHVLLDPLTRLITKNTMLARLKEKIDNSKRNGFPFSVISISLTPFSDNRDFSPYERDAILQGVVGCFKDEVRPGVDIVARMGASEFLIAMPGSSLEKAKDIAARCKQNVAGLASVSGNLPVNVAIGVAEYSAQMARAASLSAVDEVDQLIRSAVEKNA